MSTQQILGAVLIGGQSRRLGRDKARVHVGGHSMQERAMAVLERVFDDVVLSVAADTDGKAGERTVPMIADREPGRGPLGALEALLTAAGERRVFVLACDLPGVDERAVRRIVRTAAGARTRSPRAWVGSSEGRLQPLCGLYAPSCLASVREQIESGRLSMHALLERIETVEIALDDLGSDVLLNVNRRSDLERARRIAGA